MSEDDLVANLARQMLVKLADREARGASPNEVMHLELPPHTWIPVSFTPPDFDKSGEYLLFAKGDEVFEGHYQAACPDPEIDYPEMFFERRGGRVYGVTHWMHKPKSPKL